MDVPSATQGGQKVKSPALLSWSLQPHWGFNIGNSMVPDVCMASRLVHGTLNTVLRAESGNFWKFPCRGRDPCLRYRVDILMSSNDPLLCLQSGLYPLEPTVVPLGSFLCRERSVAVVKSRNMRGHLVFFHSKPTESLFISSLCRIMWLVSQETAIGSDMWCFGPKHLTALVTPSDGEQEGHVCQMVLLEDHGDFLSPASPWVCVQGTLCTHTGHVVLEVKHTLFFSSTPSPPTAMLHTCTHIHTLLCQADKCLLLCFYYPPIISLLVLAIERDWANVLRDGLWWLPGPSSGF